MDSEVSNHMRAAGRQPVPPSRRTLRLGFAGMLSACTLLGCAVGPDYQRPEPPPGARTEQFKEMGGWTAAAPGEIDASQPWWKVFQDPQLNQLVDEANANNVSLQQAAAQVRQAEALVQSARAAEFPTLGANVGVGRARTDSNGIAQNNSHQWNLQAAWEPDLWGRVGRAVEAAQAGAQASAADLAAARLALQATLVNDYLQLRVDDALRASLARSIAAYEKALQLTESQQRWGVAAAADVALAEATLRTARAQLSDVTLTRKQLEHAVAVLLGKTPAEFELAERADGLAALPSLPPVPPLLPSALLQRRPDIAGAERRVAVANANIGVAQAAWFPQLSLSASGGMSAAGLAGGWLAAPYRVWALGAQLAATLYDGGLRSAQDSQARAAFDAAAAAYRQTVLSGFQEVEDNLAALEELGHERADLDAATVSARKAEQILTTQYRAGTATYAAVIVAQTLALADERSALQAHGRQLAASVALIKATGGDWTTHQD